MVTGLVGVSAATATSSRVAQSTLAEHQIHGSAWGHELPGYLASHREVFQDYGYCVIRRTRVLRRDPGPEQLRAGSVDAHHAAPSRHERLSSRVAIAMQA